jgi:stearoyl-CoA desaturase (delta-9 desaturase)
VVHLLVAVLAGLALAELVTAITTVYLHRAGAHRALTLSPVVEQIFRPVIWITTGLRPREWIAVHRRHHAATDTEEDPHSPAVVGFWRVQLGNAGLYRRAAKQPRTVAKYGRDYPPDSVDRWFYDRAALGLGAGIVFFCVFFQLVWGQWWLGLIASAVHAVTYLGLGGAVNAMGHTIGRRPYENSATNSRLLGWITAGEGLHNNHHAFPTSARLSRLRSEVDPGWWIVSVLCRLHLAELRVVKADRVAA